MNLTPLSSLAIATAIAKRYRFSVASQTVARVTLTSRHRRDVVNDARQVLAEVRLNVPAIEASAEIVDDHMAITLTYKEPTP